MVDVAAYPNVLAGVLAKPIRFLVCKRTSVEVDHGLQSNLSLDVVLLLCLGHLLGEVVQRGYVCLVVLVVVELHDLTGDGRFECAIIVWTSYKLHNLKK